MINLLYICTDWYEIEGSTRSLINLIHAVKDEVYPIVLVNNHGKVADLFQGLGIETIVAPFFYIWDNPKPIITALHHPKRSLFYRRLTQNTECCKQVLSYLGNRKIDIVHTNTTVTDVGIALSKSLKAKHVWHIRENLTEIGVHPYGGYRRHRRLIENADYRIFISKALRDFYDFPSQNADILHDAVFSILPIPNTDGRQPIILFCAADINDFKGAPLAVEAFCLAFPNTSYRLVFAGNCSESYKRRMIAQAEEHGMGNRLDFFGYQSDMEPLYRKAAVFLMCSRYEGLGRVTLEAMAYGCPVVALDSGGTTDFVIHEETGFLFDSIDKCVSMLKRATNEDCRGIVSNACRVVKEEYTEKIFRERLMAIYKKLSQ